MIHVFVSSLQSGFQVTVALFPVNRLFLLDSHLSINVIPRKITILNHWFESNVKVSRCDEESVKLQV